MMRHLRFQSTRPLRVETSHQMRERYHADTFNPLDPRGLRPYTQKLWACQNPFQSTRPSRVETRSQHPFRPAMRRFQSTRPSRVETTLLPSSWASLIPFQSTRPSRVETGQAGKGRPGKNPFNPLDPRGLRLQITAVFPKILLTFGILFGSLRNLLTSCHSYVYSCKEFWCERPGNFMFTCLSHQAMLKFFGKIIALSCLKKTTRYKAITLYKPLLSHILVYLISSAK